MTYQSIVEMAASESLTARVAACAAQEGYPGVVNQWAERHIWTLASASDWVAAWDSAKATAGENANPDTGIRDDVITDPMILSAVQAHLPDPDDIVS